MTTTKPTTKTSYAKLAAKIRKRGFDKSTACSDGVHVSCSQCQALVINGIATHEHNCPNARK